MRKKVLITGVAGMIGSHLLDALMERPDHEVAGIDDLSFGKTENIARHLKNPRFRFHETTITDFESIKALGQGIDIIVHLAAVKKIAEADSAMKTLMVNAKGTEHILELAKCWGSKVLFASTSDVYGMSTDLPLREDGDLLIGPSMIRRWSYAVSKLYGEQLAYSYYKDFKVPIIILRYFGAFSPRSSFAWSGGHIPIFIQAILNNQEVLIHGDGSQTRSMAYVDDIVEGTLLAMDAKTAIGEIINIGNTEEMSVLDCAHLIHRIADTGHPLKVKFVPFNEVFGQYKDIMRRVPDLSKANRILGYRPRISTAQAVQKVIAAIHSSGPVQT